MFEMKAKARVLSLLLLSNALLAVSSTPASAAASNPSPESAQLLQSAYTQLQKGAYEPAVNLLVQAVRMDRDSVSARRYLAFALLSLGASQDAAEQLALVMRMAKPTTFDKYSLGEAYLRLGRYELAQAAFDEALQIEPAYDPARAGLIKTLTLSNNWGKALDQCVEGYRQARNEKLGKYYRSLYTSVQQQCLASRRLVNPQPQTEFKPAETTTTTGGDTTTTTAGGDMNAGT